MKTKKFILILVLLAAVVGGIVAFMGYGVLRSSNVSADKLIQIPGGSSFEDVLAIIKTENVLDDTRGFEQIATLKKYPDLIKSGQYLIEAGMSNEEVVNRLRSGDQEPVNLTFNNIRTFQDLAGQLSGYLELDSLTMLTALLDDSIMHAKGFNQQTYFAAFLPNTYQVWWNTKASPLVAKLIKERERFWSKRNRRAKELGLSRVEVATLASIVQEETAIMKDAPQIAGVYLNRLRIGMPLQADPTLKFALGDQSIRRVLDKDKEVDSPYNTYKNPGLPPGPLNIPDPQYIDAVLNAPRSEHLYFCASAELDGTTVFARSYGQHLRNARAYQRALNQQGTFR